MLKYSHVQCTVIEDSFKYSWAQCGSVSTVLDYNYIVHIYIHIRLMIHNVVMNTQGVYPREAIESYCRTCPRDEDRSKLMRSSSVNWLSKCWDAPRGSRHAPLDALRGRKHHICRTQEKHTSAWCCLGLVVVTRGEKGIEPLAIGWLPPGFVLQR